MESLLTILKALATPLTKLIGYMLGEKGKPILVFKNVESGTQKWTRVYGDELRRSIPALTTFELLCTGGSSANSEIVNHKDVFISIKPPHFKEGDTVYVTSEADPFDREFLMSKENKVLIIKCVTPEGRKFNLKFTFDGFKMVQKV